MNWWEHLNLNDFPGAAFQVQRIDVTSEVVKMRPGTQEDGATYVAVYIRSSHDSSSMENVSTCYVRPGVSQEEFLKAVQRSRHHFADLFAKEKLGLAPPKPTFWLVAVSNPDDPSKRIQGLASCDPDCPTTLLSRNFCDLLGLQVKGNSSTAFLRVLGKRFLTRVGVADIQVVAVIGKDLIDRAASESGDRNLSLDQLFLDASTRAYLARRTSKGKTVLVTGSYSTEGIKRLRLIEAELFKLGYDPVLLADHPSDPESLEAKFLSFAAISRFVVYEATLPSGGIDEFAICKNNQEITAVLHEQGRMATAMQNHYAAEHTFIKFFPYPDGGLPAELRKACEWADTAVSEREKYYKTVR